MTIKTLKAVLLAGAASALISTAAFAADASDVNVGAPEASPWDIAFGVTITSDYVSRGLSNTDGGPAVQPWAEFTYNIFYAGWWGSNVVNDWENDLSLGIRPEIGPFSFDFGYVWYLYGDPSSNGAEAYAQVEVTPVDPLTLGAQFWYAPDGGATYTEVNAAVDIIDTWSASAAFGWIGNSGDDYTTWNAGLTWNPVEPLEIDFRYHYAPSSVGGVSKFVVSASLSSSLRALGHFGGPPPP